MGSPDLPLPSLPPWLQEKLPSAWQLDCEVFAAAIRPDPKLTVDEWADQKRILTPDSSKEPGQWRTDRVPHARAIMGSLSPSDPCTEVTLVAGTQVAKTEIGNNFVGFVIDVSPAPMMMTLPTSNVAKRNSKTRLAKMIDAMPCLREKISENSRDSANSATLKQFPGGVLVIAGANSAAELKSQPVRFLFEDEVDEYPDDVDGQGPADELAEKRTDTYRRNKKIYRASTPRGRYAKSKIHKHWLRSNMQRRHVPCPHCNELQVLRWEGFRYDTRKIWTVTLADSGELVEVPEGTADAKVRDTGEVLDAWYECEHCAQRIDEHHKQWMFDDARAKWIAERPHITARQGYHLPSFYSPLGWFSWKEVVEKRLQAEKDPTKALLALWHNTIAAEPYEDAGESVSDLELRKRAIEAEKPYRLGTVPRGGLLLTGSVDVQHKRLEVKVKAWGRDKESWLVDYQVIHGDTESRAPWDALDEYRTKKFPHDSGAHLRILALAIDAGFRTQTVYDFCRPRAIAHVFPVRGQSQAGKTVLGRPTKQDIDHNGQKVPNGIDLWPIGTDTAKAEIYARLKIERPGPGHMHFPLGLPDEYFRGLTAERQVTRYVKGFLKTSWEKDEVERNEPLDLEVYAYAAAIYAGLARVNWDRLEASLIATAGDLFVQAQEQQEAARLNEAAPPAEPTPPKEDVVQTSTPSSAKEPWLGRRDGWLRRE
jgi:phage terminase large subunit GpA-like protein